jgi:hypothetical protein
MTHDAILLEDWLYVPGEVDLRLLLCAKAACRHAEG